jgi:DNA-directed RNA polymerase subunit RPC12/RpoP
MELIQRSCPSCGAELSIPKGKSEIYCLYCGAKFFVNQNSPLNIQTNIPEWEFKFFNYDSASNKYKLNTYKDYQYPYENLEKATLNLWISNQRFVKEWFGEYAAQGWELTDSLDLGCLRVCKSKKFDWLSWIISDAYYVWIVEGWSVNMRRRTK